MKDQFVFTTALRTKLLTAMLVGVVMFIAGAFISNNIHRVWAALLHNTMFFTLVALASVFFITVHTLAFGGWYTVLKRIPEAVSKVVPLGMSILIAFMGLMYLDSKEYIHIGISHLYHWMEKGITDPASPNYDAIIAWKKGFLNWGTFIVLTLVFSFGWIFLAGKFREASLQEDKEGGLSNYKLTRKWSAYFAVVFAVSSSVFSWLWLMSINPHWYSTLFGWYSFVSYWVTGITVITLICIFLKENGYLTFMNENHFHDLAKYMFGFSVFWTYLWFSQYMLIWYANIPEETVYFKHIRENYRFWFWANFLINFLVPFLALMKRDFKRNLNRLKVVGMIIVFGHWLDYYLMITPWGLKHTGGGSPCNMWLMELGGALFFIALYLSITFKYLSSVPLYTKNNPFIKESLGHQI